MAAMFIRRKLFFGLTPRNVELYGRHGYHFNLMMKWCAIYFGRPYISRRDA